MNLITDAWIPVRRRESQERVFIRPYEMVDHLDDDPFLDIDAARPDFNGALIQFLIGIIQTVLTLSMKLSGSSDSSIRPAQRSCGR